MLTEIDANEKAAFEERRSSPFSPTSSDSPNESAGFHEERANPFSPIWTSISDDQIARNESISEKFDATLPTPTTTDLPVANGASTYADSAPTQTEQRSEKYLEAHPSSTIPAVEGTYLDSPPPYDINDLPTQDRKELITETRSLSQSLALSNELVDAFTPTKTLVIGAKGINLVGLPLPSKELSIAITNKSNGYLVYTSTRAKKEGTAIVVDANGNQLLVVENYSFGPTKDPRIRVLEPASVTSSSGDAFSAPEEAEGDVEKSGAAPGDTESAATSYSVADEKAQERVTSTVDENDFQDRVPTTKKPKWSDRISNIALRNKRPSSETVDPVTGATFEHQAEQPTSSVITTKSKWTSRTQEFVLPDGRGTFTWRYTKERSTLSDTLSFTSKGKKPEKAKKESRLVLEVSAPNIEGVNASTKRVAELVRAGEAQVQGTNTRSAGNGGELHIDGAFCESVGLREDVVVASCLMMLKKEVDRLRVVQAAIITGVLL